MPDAVCACRPQPRSRDANYCVPQEVAELKAVRLKDKIEALKAKVEALKAIEGELKKDSRQAALAH